MRIKLESLNKILLYFFHLFNLIHLNLNVIIITTKADRIGSTLLYRHTKAIKEKLNGYENIIVTSSTKKTGIDKIIALLG